MRRMDLLRFARNDGRLAAKIAMSIVLACVVIYLLALGAITFGQRKLLYFPFGREETPASAGLPQAEVLHLDTADGERLLAWYVPPSPGRPLILYFHGNANGIADRAERFHALTATGNGLLAVEYRGYPGSTGSPSERGLLADGEAAYAKAVALGAPASAHRRHGRIARLRRRRRRRLAPRSGRPRPRFALHVHGRRRGLLTTGCSRFAF